MHNEEPKIAHLFGQFSSSEDSLSYLVKHPQWNGNSEAQQLGSWRQIVTGLSSDCSTHVHMLNE